MDRCGDNEKFVWVSQTGRTSESIAKFLQASRNRTRETNWCLIINHHVTGHWRNRLIKAELMSLRSSAREASSLVSSWMDRRWGGMKDERDENLFINIRAEFIIASNQPTECEERKRKGKSTQSEAARTGINKQKSNLDRRRRKSLAAHPPLEPPTPLDNHKNNNNKFGLRLNDVGSRWRRVDDAWDS